MAVNTSVFAVEQFVIGHNFVVAGVNWPHIVQIGASVTFLVMAAFILAQVLKLPRIDPAWLVGRLFAASPYRIYATGQMLTVAVGIVLAGGGVIGANTIFGWWPSDAVGQDLGCEM
jgi:hypothetical protein